MEADNTEVSPENGEPVSRLTFGARRVSAPISPMSFDCRVSVVKADIAIGTFCTFCSRFCAVTTISSSASWAIAGPPTNAVPKAAAT